MHPSLTITDRCLQRQLPTPHARRRPTATHNHAQRADVPCRQGDLDHAAGNSIRLIPRDLVPSSAEQKSGGGHGGGGMGGPRRLDATQTFDSVQFPENMGRGKKRKKDTVVQQIQHSTTAVNITCTAVSYSIKYFTIDIILN